MGVVIGDFSFPNINSNGKRLLISGTYLALKIIAGLARMMLLFTRQRKLHLARQREGGVFPMVRLSLRYCARFVFFFVDILNCFRAERNITCIFFFFWPERWYAPKAFKSHFVLPRIYIAIRRCIINGNAAATVY